jgi:sec-independent protein translocase protein TatA
MTPQEPETMPHLGIPELMIVFLIIIVLFGANRLPQIGRGIGEGIRNLKKGLKSDENPDQLEEKTGSTRNP